MPFDTALQSSETITKPTPLVGNTLAAHGIKPVPREQAEAHKITVVANFCALGPEQSNLVRIGRAHWVSRSIGLNSYGECEPKFGKIKLALLRPAGVHTFDPSGAPASIIKVAKTVHRTIREPMFSVEYFYDDPILNVSYIDDAGLEHIDCLGIWDHHVVVAVAETTHRLSRFHPLISRLFG